MACGGKVVVDGGGTPGEGGSGGTSATTTVTAPSSVAVTVGVGGAGGCDGLQADAVATLAAAQACNPALSVPQCSGITTTVDLCGCPVDANNSSFQAAQLANMAFSTWVSAGCGPFACDTCPPPPDSPWECDPNESICKPVIFK
jgi:hypothetical protein